MAKTVSERLLGRASVVSYLMGIEIILYVPVMIFLMYGSLLNLSGSYTYTYAGLGPPPAAPFTLYLGTLVTMAVTVVGLSLNVFFGYFNIELGKYYGVPTLRRAGKAGIVFSILSLIILPLEVVQNSLPSILGATYVYVYNGPYLMVFILFLTLGIADLLVALEYIVMMYRGFGEIGKKTGLDSFDTAKTMWLVGLFTYVTMPIAMILYGNSLRRLRRKEQITFPEKGRRPELGAQINYCSRCGSSIEPGEHFCARCGSPVYDEAG